MKSTLDRHVTCFAHSAEIIFGFIAYTRNTGFFITLIFRAKCEHRRYTCIRRPRVDKLDIDPEFI